MPGSLLVRVVDTGRSVEVQRDPEVSDIFWSRARAHWGSAGRRPGFTLEVPPETFLDNLGWLPAACREFQVGIRWSDPARELVTAYRGEANRLGYAIERSEALDPVQLDDRLAETRLVRELRGFQRRDLSHLLGLPNGANFSVPGAGKTAVQLACFDAERVAGRVSRMLVVAPLSAFEAWETEAEETLAPVPVVHPFDGGWIPSDAEIVLVNYQRLTFSYEDCAGWVQAAPTLVCLDEAHRIKKGRAGEWGNTCLNLGFLAARRDILTGTPAPQSPRDLGVLLDFLWLGRGHEVLPAGVWVSDPAPTIGHQVAEAIGPLFVRTTKSELGLPPLRRRVVPVEPDQLQRDIYAALVNRYSGLFAVGRRQRSDFIRMGRVLMYLLEAACNPGLLTAGSSEFDPLDFRHPPLAVRDDASLGDLLAAYGAYETPAKFVALGRILQENRRRRRKTLVWSNFVRNLEVLRDELARYEPAVVHGGIPSRLSAPDANPSREDEIDRFRDDSNCWVLLANPAAIGEGVSLHTACHDAVYLERTFNAGQYLQSLDRIHRLGLGPRTETRVKFLVTPETIDEAVAHRVHEKAERLGAMLDDPDIVTMALPDDEDLGAPFDPSDAGDTAALFAHLRGKGG